MIKILIIVCIFFAVLILGTVWLCFCDERKMIELKEIEVRHGKWIRVDDTKCKCSCCDIIAFIALYPCGDKNYCPNCGAKMDEGDNGNENL